MKLLMPYKENIMSLKKDDIVYITGDLLVMRDAAHKKIFDMLAAGEKLPFDINGKMIYYMGPCPTQDGYAIGSCGPTTSSRMDTFTPKLMEMGLIGTIGKGSRNKEVEFSIKKNNGIYLSAIGGAGAYYASTVKSCEIIAFPELLAEAVRLIKVEDFPTIVVIAPN